MSERILKALPSPTSTERRSRSEVRPGARKRRRLESF
jgi:hypothetical protein